MPIVMKENQVYRINEADLAFYQSRGFNVADEAPKNPDWEVLSLAQIRVNAGVGGILTSNIQDERFDTELCGIINSVLGLDPSAWQAQFDAFMAAMRTDSYTELEQFFTEQKNAFNAWFAGIQIDPQRYIIFDFDDIIRLPGTTRFTNSLAENEILEAIRITGSNVVVATRGVVFNVDGSVTTTQTLYDEGGLDIMYTRTITTEFPANDSIIEKVSN